MRLRLGFSAIALCVCLVSALASAQGWVQLPNGQWGYITDYTTSGFFTCGNPFNMLGSCTASGNRMTLASGGNAITFTFQGVTQTITASGQSQQVHVGRITKSFAGSGPYVFPSAKSLSVPLFYFSIVLNTSFPIAGSGTWSGGYRATSQTQIPVNCCQGQSFFTFPTIPRPTPHPPNAQIYYYISGPTMSVGPDPTDVVAKVSLTPEPATLWLTGSGLVGLLALRRRRQKR